MSSALVRSSWPDSPPICRSISSTIFWVDSRWRSRLLSSSLTSWTWPSSALLLFLEPIPLAPDFLESAPAPLQLRA